MNILASYEPSSASSDRPASGAQHRARLTLTAQLQEALNSRIIIEQAKGAYAQQHGISVDDAFRNLRQEAGWSRRNLLKACREALEQH